MRIWISSAEVRIWHSSAKLALQRAGFGMLDLGFDFNGI